MTDQSRNGDTGTTTTVDANEEGRPLGFNDEEPILRITSAAQEKIRSVLGSQDPPAHALRISSQYRGNYSMNLEPDGKPGIEDTVLPFAGFDVYIDPHSQPLV